HANLAAGMDVAGNGAFAGHARGFLLRAGCAGLAENDDGLLHVAAGLGEGLFAIHHGGAGEIAKFFDLCCGNVVHSSCAHNRRWSLVLGPWLLAKPEPTIVLTKFYPRLQLARAGPNLLND